VGFTAIAIAAAATQSDASALQTGFIVVVSQSARSAERLRRSTNGAGLWYARENTNDYNIE
jgi:hypothetical protein